MNSKIKAFIQRISGVDHVINLQSKNVHQLDELKVLTAKFIETNRGKISSIIDAEFKVFSQFGDDGIISYLVDHVEIENKTFVEFGVEDYTESNTRYLLISRNWKGLVMDGSESNVNSIKKDTIYWRHDLTARSAFISVENVNDLIKKENISGNIGLLHIDIDGNDFWVWKHLSVVNADIVIVEYNSVFGKDHAITVPYDSAFVRSNYHYSNLYWGCSLKALYLLGKEKGYDYVGCNSNGNNAYFIKASKMNDAISAVSLEEGYVESKFRESRDKAGKLNYISGGKRLHEIRDMTVYDTEQNKEVKIKELFNLN